MAPGVYWPQMDLITRHRRGGEAAPKSGRVIVLANRAPYRHERGAHGGILAKRSASGLVTALEPLVRAHSGIWVAHGSGEADSTVVDRRDGLMVPPASPEYRLRYVWLPEEEHRGYYFGFANEGLWPLCHAVAVPPVFRSADFCMYRAANARFANAVAQEAHGGAPLILVQDYHFALAPRMLRRLLPASTVVAFWHIPWPDAKQFRSCPWALELIEGLLGSSIVGFQTRQDCLNFLETVELFLDADVNAEDGIVTHRGVSTAIRSYPVGVAPAAQVVRDMPGPAECRERVLRNLQLPADCRLAVGVDRLDYTKGLHQKFLAIEHLLETRPELRGRFAFVQVAEPSRDCLPQYRAARSVLLETTGRVNARFGSTSCRPIYLLEEHHEPADVYRLYRSADVCVVASLRDGMNLVAKEFVSARDDEQGVLVLSRFAGAAQQLRAALLVNSADERETAAAIDTALQMPRSEQSRRMKQLRRNVAAFDAAWWAKRLISDALAQQDGPYSAPAPQQPGEQQLSV